MNIEEYINLDSALIMIGFVGLLVIMVIYFGFRVASFLLDQQYLSVNQYVDDEDEPKQIPMAGHTWYPRLELENSWLNPSPWIDKDKPSITILEKRYDWIRYAEEGSDESKYAHTRDFIKKFMKDEFGDIVEPKENKPEPEPEKEVKPVDVSPIPAENIVKIDGKDFILTPVKNEK